MESVKNFFRILARGSLVIRGQGDTFAKAPVWLCVLAVLGGGRAIRFAVLTGIVIVATGMQVSLERG